MEQRVCRKCGALKLTTEFTPPELLRNYPRCRACLNAYVKQHYAENESYREARKAASRLQVKSAEMSRKHNLKHKYKITPERYDEILLSQGGGCALCGTQEPGSKQWKGYFHIDHDHVTDVVRGILCQYCNTRLGSFEALVEKVGLVTVMEYLKRGKRPDA